MKHTFLDLGKHPMANNFLTNDQIADEFTFNLKVQWDSETRLVSLVDFVPPENMFNDHYAYRSSLSQTMRNHFKSIADNINLTYKPKTVLEIGSDDGVFLKHFDTTQAYAIEPCGNFCDMTNDMGYTTYNEFWTLELAEKLVKEIGTADVIYSANCMCHVQNLSDAFDGIRKMLTPVYGVFVFEDPSFFSMFERTSYDQIYDEHAHIFSVTSLSNILKQHGLSIFRVDKLTVHGGSNRIWACNSLSSAHPPQRSVTQALLGEQRRGVNFLHTYNTFATNVEQSKNDLLSLLTKLKNDNKKIVSYGATSKSTTVFNYCGIDANIISCIYDTTPEKQGKLLPGVHIPVLPYTENSLDGIDYAFLGAWNYESEIINKEKKYVDRGGKFISHVPNVRVLPR